MEKIVENPYKKGKKVGQDVDVRSVCMAKGTGIMFNCFDLGKLCLDNPDRIWVFKNNAADLIRKFVNDVESGKSVDVCIVTLSEGLKKLGKLAIADLERYKIYEDEITQIINKLREGCK